MDVFQTLSDQLAACVAAAEPFAVGVAGGGKARSGILWQPDAAVVSEQLLPPDATEVQVSAGGRQMAATLAGRDPGTNIAVLRLSETAAMPAPWMMAPPPRAGSLALLLGAGATARLAMVHAVGPSWHSMAGGRIDALIRLDCRLGAEEGGPVLAPGGGLIGMSTSGPRRQAIVIPAATLARVVGPLLAEGAVPRGWLGVGLQPVTVPDSFKQAAGAATGLMVVSLAGGGPAEAAGVLPGDIVLAIDGAPIPGLRALNAAVGGEAIGRSMSLRMLRAGAVLDVAVTIGRRP